ncbi:LysM domain [Moorella glycerini]|uniref:D-gamma-glutamyl-meso-diaminopimelic acid endopeptidase CwlS n=1 Tax=Neomoorella stamsii TaxID=1266720 RepID=A0A9X7P6E8_9FIRM|nr:MULTISPECIES: LysM peptidoglycan-binding domain-containing protein [Moorella]PRR72936.1 D-gamma-glutamyl-meso-diaminopimelic acid endopeptidase CwlS precursor [Moorella stamsii]CEP67607.1 LysM domain [Moorella glycerini]
MRVWRFWGVVFFLTAILLWGAPPAAWAGTGSGIILYQVRQGDSLWLLAQRYGATVAAIQQLNKLPGDALVPGQVLYLPVTLQDSNYKYTVQRGDTLYLISLRTGRSIAAIQAASNLAGDTLYPGQTLLIPLARSGATIYQVQPGDNLYLIARRFNLTVTELSRFNNLPSDLIMVGQVMEIPPAPAPQPQPVEPELPVYRVVAGDTLSTIAQRFNTTVRAIYDTNRLNSDILMPGQPLYIPVSRTEPVPVAGPRGKQKPGYGEFLDWEWARWIYNVGAVATITDLDSGLSFRVRHLGGSNHADSEPLTAADTATMKQIFNGRWSWDTRAILLKVGDRVLAASMAGMPHSVETILDNDFPGHFDVYFWNSRSHNTNEIQPQHQANVLRAAGLEQAP